MGKKSKIQTDYYEPIPKQVIEKIITNADGEKVVKKYGYLFEKLTLEQATAAEERTTLRLQRIDAMTKPQTALTQNGDEDYFTDMAGILFTPLDKDGAITIWVKELKGDVADELKTATADDLKKVEEAINDFFTRRENRAKYLEANGSARESRRFLTQTMDSLQNYFSQNNCSSLVSSIEDLAKVFVPEQSVP